MQWAFSRGLRRRRTTGLVAALVLFMLFLAALLPRVQDAAAMLAVQDDPAALSELKLDSVLARGSVVIESNIASALAAGDADLANSFLELARARNIALPESVVKQVEDAVVAERSTLHVAKRFATGLVIGSADDVASLSGTVVGDLLVIGDIRDVVREGKHLAVGEETDHVVLGLAVTGIAVTGATYVSLGGFAPVRAGVTMVKDARKLGRLGSGLALWAGRVARDVVDTKMLREAVASGSLMRPGQTIGAIKAAFRVEKAGGLVRLGKDVARVSSHSGTRGAMDVLRIAEGPKDVSRAAKLAEKMGGKTRAVIKLLGRGALLLFAGLMQLMWWLFAVLFALFGVLSTIKSSTERVTRFAIRRGKARRLRRELAAAAAMGRCAA